MATIETYQERINTLKTSIETLKRDDAPLIVFTLNGVAHTVREASDLRFVCGTVIAGSGDHVYLRVPHLGMRWASSNCDIDEPDGYGLEEFYDFLRRRAAGGEQFRIVYQPKF